MKMSADYWIPNSLKNLNTFTFKTTRTEILKFIYSKTSQNTKVVYYSQNS